MFGVILETFNVKVNGLADIPFSAWSETIVALPHHILNEVLMSVAKENYVRVRIKYRSLRFPIWTPLMKKSQVTVGREWMKWNEC